MAQIVLNRDEKIWMGEVIARCANNSTELIALMQNPNQYLSQQYEAHFGTPRDFGEAVIVPHVNSDDVMNISIPFKDFMMANAGPHSPYGNYKHPGGYTPGHPDYVDPGVDPDMAYYYRVGDYVFAQCG